MAAPLKLLAALALLSCAPRPAPPDAGFDWCRDSRLLMRVEERRVLCAPRELER